MVVTPHSMGTERVVSHHNKIKSLYRSFMGNNTINDHLPISVNGVETELFDLCPSSAAFLKKKDRSNPKLDMDLYQDRDFTKKVFRQNSIAWK